MKKEILTSISPYQMYLQYIGEQDLVFKVNCPSCDFPIIVNEYCTQDMKSLRDVPLEYHEIVKKWMGKVVAKFTLNKIRNLYDILMNYYEIDDFLEWNLLTNTSLNEIHKYANHDYKRLYAWHIENLVVFDKPKDLYQFKHFKWVTVYSGMDCPPYYDQQLRQITRPPQAFMYCYNQKNK